ncbi:4-amino-4-deoxychorismate lyase [Isorropodon fossajaponicum endosymbiont JTNG4]|uniref:aminodeoxychorismate lyase n=1 Tax=Isorropodon fossajaponicum symbiont TaxID=883811 RepID=UPI0019162A58|nr:aminodeoxychorismate lyase [Isorropodon fossajaponicum symbiont]BBB24468.1 4-amino-4-deoxychorismate lyase [Isorropodon fossajaponicum endosymbiont JTNG4]
MDSTLLINGKKQTKLSALNRLVQFGDGLFETCLIEDARVLFWSKHFSRLKKGCDKLKIHPVSEAIWLKEIAKAFAISKLDRAVVKIILSRGESTRGYGYEKNIKPTRIIIISPVPDLPWQYELGVCSSGYVSNQLLSEIKHCNRLEQILARSELQTQECIMLDENAQVISVTQGNIFAIRNQVIFTSSLTNCGIEGTRRSVVFDLAQVLGLQLEICSLSLIKLLEADEVFITNSVIGIKPVAKINQQLFSHHQITNQLISAFARSKNNHSSSILLKSKQPYLKFIIVFLAISLLFWMYWANTIKANNSVVYQISSRDQPLFNCK